MSFGHPYILDVDGCIHDGWLALRPKDNNVVKEFIYHILGSEQIIEQFTRLATGGVVNNLNSNLVRNVEIPLPPLEIQRQIVDEIAAHQRIIDGARQVVEGWAPDIEIDEEWDKAKLGDICENLDSQRKPVTKSDRVEGQYPYYGASGIVDYVEDYIFDGKYLLVSEDGANLLARSTPIAFSVEGKVWVNNHAHILKFEEPATQSFVEIYLNSIDLSNYVTGAAQPKLSQGNMNKIEIPLPPLEAQREIVARIERERSIVEGNRELIRIYEEKVKKVIERVWEG
jgi:restriction endonuclease S subunit